MFKTSIYFEGKDLSTLPGVSVYNHNFLDLPNRVLAISKLARADKSVLTSAEYSDKKVSIQLMICGATPEITESNYINLLGYIQNTNGTLGLSEGSLNVSYTSSTLQSVSHQYFGNTLKVDLEFICTDPFGIDTLDSVLLDTTVTAGAVTFPIIVDGSYRIEPIVKVVYNSLIDGTGKTVKISNDNSQRGISVMRDWVLGDVLEVNSLEKTVTVNNTIVDFAGTFPNFLPGPKIFGYVDDFTSRSAKVDISYNKRI